MINFYPGPSKLHPRLGDYLKDALHSGILSMNHRSDTFMAMLGQTVGVMRQKLKIPKDYVIFFPSSATECWEIVSQSLVDSGNGARSIHIFNGAFGQKWAEYAGRLSLTAQNTFSLDEVPSLALLEPMRPSQNDVLCLTHNETSNATTIPEEAQRKFRQSFEGLIVMDATSSMGGVKLDWLLGDIWLASVQKCFGLPPGLGIMIASPKAINRALEINDQRFYNSFLFLQDNFSKNQTPYTPNTLAIYLLGKVLDNSPEIDQTDELLTRRFHKWFDFFEKEGYSSLVKNSIARSKTVLAISASNEFIRELKKAAALTDIILGNGYGMWKGTTLRIANFPALEQSEIERLRYFLKDFISSTLV